MAQTTAAGGNAAGDHTHGESAADESAADGEGPGDSADVRGAGTAEESCDALALADLAATHLLDDPGPAERHLRRALLIGDGTLPAEHLARLGSQLVMVVAGQSGRERELADVALRAAARWEGISAADASHLSFVAARAYHRAGRHEQAAAQFERSLAAGSAPYPDIEMAVLRGQYGKSLKLLGRYRAAAEQFVEAARLVRDAAGRSNSVPNSPGRRPRPWTPAARTTGRIRPTCTPPNSGASLIASAPASAVCARPPGCDTAANPRTPGRA